LAEAAGAGYPGTEIYSSHMRYAALILGGREHVQVRFPASRRPPWCIWDHVGAQLIYTESGAGKITDLRGRPIDFGTGRDMMGNYGLIAADESVHGRILELVTEMLERDGDITPVEA
jgi:3'(2'), 5'-bisphosphate nucleotidase